MRNSHLGNALRRAGLAVLLGPLFWGSAFAQAQREAPAAATAARPAAPIQKAAPRIVRLSNRSMRRGRWWRSLRWGGRRRASHSG
jgi:hypothetical protein